MIHNQISKLKSFPNSFPNIEYPINFVSFRYPYDITYPIIEYLAISFIRKMPRFRLGVLSREGSRPSFGTKSHGSISRVRGRHAREILRCTIYIYRFSRHSNDKILPRKNAPERNIDNCSWGTDRHPSMKQSRFRLFERCVLEVRLCVWSEANNPGNNTDRSKNDGRLIKNLRFPFLYRP